jgi:hypothetical protein
MRNYNGTGRTVMQSVLVIEDGEAVSSEIEKRKEGDSIC